MTILSVRGYAITIPAGTLAAFESREADAASMIPAAWRDSQLSDL